MTAPTPVSQVFFPLTGTNFAIADPSVSGTVNQPIVQPVSGLVLFTPRLPKGQVFWVANYLVQAAYNGEQTVNIINNPSQGTFTLQLLGTWTSALPFNVSTAAMQAALITAAQVSNPAVTTGDITVAAGTGAASYDVKFAGHLASTQIPVMNANPGTLMNAQGQGCEVTVDGTSLGGPQIVAPTGITIPPLQARIWDGTLSTIDESDTPGFQLPSNMPEFNLTSLIYDVTFDSVTYNGGPGMLAPWAFTAPVDTTPVCLTDPALVRLPWQPPISATWAPPAPPGLRVVRSA